MDQVHSRSLSDRRRLSNRTALIAALLASGALTLGVSAPAEAAVLPCTGSTLPRGDDNFSSLIPLGFTIKFGAGTYSNVYVDTNGYVTFGTPPPPYFDYNQLRLDLTSRPIIAPFLADVDTRNPASGVITYGTTASIGNNNFCVTWDQVGYYDQKIDKKNTFQLVIVQRLDLGPDAFDIQMYYDSITWNQTTSALTYNPPQPPSPTWFGYAPGGATFMAGSGTFGDVFLDSGATPLATSSAGSCVGSGCASATIQNGFNQPSGIVTGVLLDPFGDPMPGAIAQICLPSQSPELCPKAVTDSTGTYTIVVPNSAISATAYSFTASTAPGTPWVPPGAINVTPIASQTVPVPTQTFEGFPPMPAGTTISSTGTTSNGVPIVHWNQNPINFSTIGPSGLTGSFTIKVAMAPSSLITGTLTETTPQGTYTGSTTQPLNPLHGWATVVMAFQDTDGSLISSTEFAIYIDPSGFINNTEGRGIAGAIATLYRAEHAWGPFLQVPDGSAIMSPANRTNPMLSEDDGHFGWDTIAGYYIVRAEKEGCTSPEDASIPYAETDILPVPPPVTDLDIRLDCSAVPPPVVTVPQSIYVEATNSSGATVVYDASAFDAADGAVPVTCSPESGSLFPLGTTNVTCEAVNSYGNVATTSFVVTVADTIAPMLSLPSSMSAYATSAAGASVSYLATATDSIEGDVQVNCTPSSGFTFQPGVTTVSCEATDSSGNQAEGSFDVHVTFEWGGIHLPLAEQGPNIVKKNQITLVRFNLGGVSDGIATLVPQLFVAKVVGGVVGAEAPAESASGEGNVFQQIGSSGSYQLPMSTKNLTVGIYRLRIDLGDGESHTLPLEIVP